MNRYWLLGVVIFSAAVLLSLEFRGVADEQPAERPVRVEPREGPPCPDALGGDEMRTGRKRMGPPEWSEMMGPGRREEQMTDEEVMEFLKAHLPEMHQRLQELREQRAEQFNRRIQWMRHAVQRLRRLREENAEVFSAEIKTRRLGMETFVLAEKIRATKDPEEREKLIGKLRTNLSELFDAKMVLMKAHIARLERELAELKDVMARRAELKEKIVQKRLDQLVTPREESGLLDWDF